MLRQRSPPKQERGELESASLISTHVNVNVRRKKGQRRFLTKGRLKLVFIVQSVLATGLLLRALYRRAATGYGRRRRRLESEEPSKYPHGFLLPALESGEVAALAWEKDGSRVQEYAARVGFPRHLVPTLTEYIEDIGLMEIMKKKPYDSPIQPGESERYSFRSPYQEGAEDGRALTWEAIKPSDHTAQLWHSDATWFNTADELAHEDALRALAKGGFDDVLEGLGEWFDLDELHVDSVGFFSMTKNDGEYWHSDFKNVEGGGFGLLFEIGSGGAPGTDHGKDLYVEGSNGLRGEIEYSKHVGLVIGDATRHATSLCDHQAHRGTRVTAIVYLNELTESNIDKLSGDTSAWWPPLNIQTQWMWAQRGRHWRRDGTGPGLLHDRGRAPLEAADRARCRKQDCYDEDRRDKCLITCKLILDDSYYKPGVSRRKLFGY